MITSNGVLKSLRRITKPILAKFFTFLLHKTNKLHFAVVCTVIDIHGRRHNVVRTSVTHSPRRLVGHFFVLIPHYDVIPSLPCIYN